jgi:predicted amidohydrolase
MIKSNLRITIVQSNLHWENVEGNLNMFNNLLAGLAGNTDIIILPEMFTTGFTINSKTLAESTTGLTLEWMQQKAAEIDAAITGSIIAKEKGSYFNRLLWVNPDGSWEKYDKRHLFTMAREDEYFSPGKKRLIVNYKGWKILPMICYDLRFPVWSRNKKQPDGQAEFDLMIYVANWPEARKQPWKKLLMARAIENQAFVVGVNRVGADGKGIVYSGDSSVINPYGEYIVECEVGEEQVLTLTIAYHLLSEFRKKFPVLDDGDL